MGFFEKQKSFGRRCGGTVAMRPQSYDFSASVFKVHRSRPSRPNFSKLFLYFFNPKTCSKTSANLFAPPFTRSCATAVQTKSSTFDSNMAVWRPSWPNFQKLFFFFFDLLTSPNTWANVFAHPTTSIYVTAKKKIAIFPKGSAWISRTVCMYVCMYVCMLSLIHIWRCRRIERCRSRWSPYH